MKRWLLTFAAGAALWLLPQDLAAHVGHEHAPEPEAPVMAVEFAPRFYAVTDLMQGVLVFPRDDAESTVPLLYVTEHISNRPIDGAEVLVDLLSGPDVSIRVTTGTALGSYALAGLEGLATTATLMIDVTKGTLSDILTFDRVYLEADESIDGDEAESTLIAMVETAGLPGYVWRGLIAIHAILVLAAVYVLFSYAVGCRKRGGTERAVIILMLAGAPGGLVAHTGDDHAEPVFTSTGPVPASGRHFVPIETQVGGDIQTSEVKRQMLPRAFRALGQVEIRADRRAVVTPPAEGRLLRPAGRQQAVPVLGEQVAQGEVLVVVEQIIPAAEKVTLTSERAQVEAELRVAEQELGVARREAERSEQLGPVISNQELERARADLRIALDRVAGMKRRMETLESAVSGGGPGVREIPILAPLSGYITSSHAVVGEYVRTDKTLFEIISVDEVFVGADVFETDLPKVREATQARITVEAYQNESFTGALHSIGQEIDPGTRSAHVLFSLNNADEKLRGGMFANIEIETGGEREVLTIPKTALFSRDGVRQVFKKIAPETFAAEPVQTLEFRGDVVVVQGNLTPGDLIAISGLYQIRMSPVIDETP